MSTNAHKNHSASPVELPRPKRPGQTEDLRAATAEPGGGNVERIRDILFGNHMRDYDARFSRLEEQLLKESSDLRDATKRRIDALETFFKGEIEALAQRLKSEKEDRSAAARNLSAELKTLGDSLSQRLSDVADQDATAQRELRRQILEQSTQLGEEINRTREAVIDTLERRFQELRKDKTDRAALAALFTDVAMRLNGEFALPEVDG